jgi:UPF0042 nucleotide-binding protein
MLWPDTVEITTYGVLHNDPPRGDALSVDLTAALRNPHRDPALRQLTGLDDCVREHVLSTPGAQALIERTVRRLAAVMHAGVEPGQPLRLHVYCQGGRHRSVAIAEAVAAELRGWDLTVTVTHRHLTHPVIQP